MSTNNPDGLVAFMVQQREVYRHELPQRLAKIESLWEIFRRSEEPREGLNAIERCAHNLAGSSATFGFSEIGDAARDLELLLSESPHDFEASFISVQSKISLAIEALRRALVDAGVTPNIQAIP